MSWSIAATGKPDKVVEYINKTGDALTGQTRDEFDLVRDHMIGIVEAHTCKLPSEHVKIEASGSGQTNNGELVGNTCRVSVEPVSLPISV